MAPTKMAAKNQQNGISHATNKITMGLHHESENRLRLGTNNHNINNANKTSTQNNNKNNRRPLQAIDTNLVTVRVQPPREAKRQQQQEKQQQQKPQHPQDQQPSTSFNVFIDEYGSVATKASTSVAAAESSRTYASTAPAIPAADVFKRFVDSLQPRPTCQSSVNLTLTTSSQHHASSPWLTSIEEAPEEELYADDIFKHVLAREKNSLPKPRFVTWKGL